MLSPIETYWNGYHFRSRLEARWAVFFDMLGIEYEYEPDGFDLDGVWYLPDFWLPNLTLWVEIKPKEDPVGREKVRALAIQSDHPAWIIEGTPWPWEYGGCLYSAGHGDSLRDWMAPTVRQRGGDLADVQVQWLHCATCQGVFPALTDGRYYNTWLQFIQRHGWSNPASCNGLGRSTPPGKRVLWDLDPLSRAYCAARQARWDRVGVDRTEELIQEAKQKRRGLAARTRLEV